MKSARKTRRPTLREASEQRTTDNGQLTTAHAFTLIELLVVISIIAILASLIFPVTAAVNAAKIKSRTKAELAQIETAIQRYQTKLGHYPPDNPVNPALNQLFYELMGTTNDTRAYTTLDGSSTIPPAGYARDGRVFRPGFATLVPELTEQRPRTTPCCASD